MLSQWLKLFEDVHFLTLIQGHFAVSDVIKSAVDLYDDTDGHAS